MSNTQPNPNDIFVTQPFDGRPHQEANAPRAIVVFRTLGNLQLQVIPLEYELTLAIHGVADTARVVVPNKGNVDWTWALFRGQEAGNANSPVYIKIYSGLQLGSAPVTLANLTPRFFGIVDQYEIEVGPPNDHTTFSCRSMASALIDAKIIVPLQSDVTTTQFVQQMAKRFGMSAVTNLVAPAVTMQQVLRDELIAGVHAYSVWELITRASLSDDADAWVDPLGVIHYESRTRVGRPDVVMQWGRDIKEGMRLTHSPQFSKNIQVDVRIYNPQTKTSTITRAILGPDGSSMSLISGSRTVTSEKIPGTLTTVTQSISKPYMSSGMPMGDIPGIATSTTTTLSPEGGAFNASGREGRVAGDSGKERYPIWIKGPITKQAALEEARRRWLDISQHEYRVQMTVPITQALAKFDINHNIKLQGLPYIYFNSEYWPREIMEHFSPTGGFFWDITAINHEPPAGTGA